jgi:asparagine synthase (glutamine-hydrolysing)
MGGVRAIAGIHDLSQPPARETVVAALGPEAGGPAVVSEGPLTVAWSAPGSTPVPHDGPLCLLDGHIYEFGPQARRCEAAAEEVVLEVYARLGDAMFEHLRGDFVLFLWDPRAQEGRLVRDHMGGRALYWHSSGSRLTFASEVRYLMRLLPRRPSPDRTTIANWLAVGAPPGDRTHYEGVRRLEAGCLLRFGRDRIETARYWRLAYRPPLDASRGELAERLRAALTEAVWRRSTPGTTGVLLSGGLDSSSVAALGARAVARERAPVCCYSAIFPRHPTIDESELIDGLTDELRLPGVHILVRSGSVLAGALEYLRRWETPPVSPNLFFWLPLLRRAREDGVEVLLDGEGGDELFGLSPYLLADRLRRGRLLSLRDLIRRVPGADGHPSRASVRRFLGEFALRGAVPFTAHRAVRRRREPQRYSPAWFRPETSQAYHETGELFGWKALRGPRWWAYLVHATTRGGGPTLAYDHVRRRAEMAGLEARHPLVDPDVVELMLRVPPEVSYDPRWSRPLLREAMAGVLPDGVRLRQAKSNFDALFHESLAGSDLPAVRRLLGDPRAELGAFVDLAVMRRELLDTETRRGATELQRWALQAWRAVTAECWLRLQADPDSDATRQALGKADYELVRRAPASEVASLGARGSHFFPTRRC